MHQNHTLGHQRGLESKVNTLNELLEATERTVIEQSMRLEEALTSSQGASLVKSEFLSSMSHEIRTPINVMLGMADLLAETELAPEQRHYLDIMMANGNALMDLLSSILDLSRIESGRLQLEHAQIDLTDLIERTVSTFAVQAHRKGLELVARIAPEVPGYVEGDALRLRQIIVNLLANAVKFTEQGGVFLEVNATAHSSAPTEVRFTVTDTGVGIAKDQLDSIYSGFITGEAVGRKSCNSGIGLGVAKRLADLMHGQISFESEVGVGSKFTFSAPFGLPSSALSPAPAATLDLLGHRVLVVDDHQLNRQMVSEAMTQCRAEVTEASSAAEALIAIRNAVVLNKPYQIVLLDMRMPDADGLDLVQRIHREHLPTGPLLPMIFSDDIRQQVARFKEHRLDAYLVKPITRRELCRAIERKLNRRNGVSPHDGLEKLAAVTVSSHGRNRTRILVAEDAPDNRFLIEAYLRAEPCTLTFVRDGEQAVQKATANEYDLIFMDIQMPKQDGLAATRAIRQWEIEHRRNPVPIIALTASALDQDIQRSLEAGCNAHISKPVKKRVILDAIRDAVQHASVPPVILH